MSWDTAIAAPQGRPRDRPGPGDEHWTQFLWIPVCTVYQPSNCQQNFSRSFLTKIRKLCALCKETTNESITDTGTWSYWLILLDSLSTGGDFTSTLYYQPEANLCFSFNSKLGNENYLQVRQICKTQEEEAQSQPNILDLPDEIVVNILEYLDVVDIIK